MVCLNLKNKKSRIKELFPASSVIKIIIGAIILSFGIYNIHEQVSITEGGVIGLNLFFHNLFGISVAFITPILDISCYLLALKYLGKDFIIISVFSTLTFSSFYKLWELFPPVLPMLNNNLLLASVLGGLFVGIGVGLIVSCGGSSGGDDALALVIHKKFKVKLSFAYLATDLTVLALSLTYIPVKNILYSLITVTISSFTIDFIANYMEKSSAVENKSSIEASKKSR